MGQARARQAAARRQWDLLRREGSLATLVAGLVLALHLALGCGAPGPAEAEQRSAAGPMASAAQGRSALDLPALHAAAPAVVVLGSAQDGGVPHAGCGCVRCARARVDPAFRRRGPSLGVVLPGARPWLVDASPDLAEQLALLGRLGDGRVERAPVGGILLTHAHVGHYLGLAQLGREVLGARDVPVVATPALAAFLADNAPWEQLVTAGNIALRPVPAGERVELGGGVSATAFPVPHRDEYADTVGWRIAGPAATVLYVPDTDRWEGWDPPLEAHLQGVDVALLDGSFHALDELPGRSLADVPHPLMQQTADRLQPLVDAGLRVVFTHLNHSNPAADPASPEARALAERGFEIAWDGLVIPLGAPGGGERVPAR